MGYGYNGELEPRRPKNGAIVAEFERAFADYVGAKFAVAHVNGTSTLHTALVALGVQPGDRVATTPLTMSSTTLAILHAGAVPVYCDVDPETWLMGGGVPGDVAAYLPVQLYGLCCPFSGAYTVVDGAQTLERHAVPMPLAPGLTPERWRAFTSYSFQASKILSTGEGGMLVTNDEELAVRAREFSSLGYRMRADQPRIDKDAIKSPTYERHHSVGWNYRMADGIAAWGLQKLDEIEDAKAERQDCASLYRTAMQGCSWLTPQHSPKGWDHDYWTWAVACDTPERALAFSAAIVKHGGEQPYPAWRLSYREPAIRRALGTHCSDCDRPDLCDRIKPKSGPCGENTGSRCPVAESLQPRLVQFQTNSLSSAERNAEAVRHATREIGGTQ